VFYGAAEFSRDLDLLVLVERVELREERWLDREYWEPLKEELERLRRARRN
jgi:hypothetical protein